MWCGVASVMGSSKDVEASSIFNTEMVFGFLLLQIMLHFSSTSSFMHFHSGRVVFVVWVLGKVAHMVITRLYVIQRSQCWTELVIISLPPLKN